MNDAACGVKNQGAGRIFFEASEDFVERRDFFGEILRFALGVGGAVGPTHPCGDTVDAPETASLESGSEAGFDEVVARDRGKSRGGQMLGPIGFPGTRHADER